MSPLLCMLAPLALAQSEAPAESSFPDFLVALEVGGLSHRDPAFDVFSDRNGMATIGLKLGQRLFEGGELVVGWQRSWQGTRVIVPAAIDDADFSGGDQELRTALVTDQFVLGPRADVLIRDIFLPYATVQLSAIRAGARLDDDASVPNNPNQLRASGLGFGVQGLLGGEIYVDTGTAVSVSIYGELGYATPTLIKLGELGRIRPGGMVGHFGAGVRF